MRPITKPKILIVEGKDDELLLSKLIDHLKLQDIEIRDIGGKTNIRKNLKAFTMTSGFDQVVSLGVIRDADDDPEAAFNSVRNALKNAGLPTPVKSMQLVGDHPKVTVMILPGGKKPGMLEDVCLESVRQDPAMVCVEEYFDCLEQRLQTRPRHPSKAKVHAFLASREEPDLRLGEAAQKGEWPLDHSAFKPLRKFLLDL